MRSGTDGGPKGDEGATNLGAGNAMMAGSSESHDEGAMPERRMTCLRHFIQRGKPVMCLLQPLAT